MACAEVLGVASSLFVIFPVPCPQGALQAPGRFQTALLGITERHFGSIRTRTNLLSHLFRLSFQGAPLHGAGFRRGARQSREGQPESRCDIGHLSGCQPESPAEGSALAKGWPESRRGTCSLAGRWPESRRDTCSPAGCWPESRRATCSPAGCWPESRPDTCGLAGGWPESRRGPSDSPGGWPESRAEEPERLPGWAGRRFWLLECPLPCPALRPGDFGIQRQRRHRTEPSLNSALGSQATGTEERAAPQPRSKRRTTDERLETRNPRSAAPAPTLSRTRRRRRRITSLSYTYGTPITSA